MHERKRSKLREQAPDVKDSSWDAEKIGHFVLIKKSTEMFRVESHTRVADSVGYTLDSDSLILSQLNQQICVFCFTDYCVLIFVQMKKKKKL